MDKNFIKMAEYQEPQIKIIVVKEEDIITTSGNAWEIL